MTHRLELRGITKRYPGVVANDDVSLAVAPGEIHAVLGENGAGKSTLVKIAYGALAPDAGQVFWNGAPVALHAPGQARALGIGMVFQHFMLFDTLTVAQNVLLSVRPDGAREPSRTWLRALIAHYRLDLDPDAYVGDLSVGERQRVELLRALATHPQLLILDEPTSVLSPAAKAALFSTLKQLAREGCSVVYISHKLAEIRELCDRCTVLRVGRVVATIDPGGLADEALAALMLGGAVDEAAPLPARGAGEALLRVQGLKMLPPVGQRIGLRDVSFDLHAGEILGIAGVSGNGQALLLEALSGEAEGVPDEAVQWRGQAIGRLGPADRRGLGLRAVPEERLGRGCVPEMSLEENMLLTMAPAAAARKGWVDTWHLTASAERVMKRFGVRAVSAAAPARSLSGGNLQKFMVGRELDGEPLALLAAHPTWGLDVGAAARIHRALADLRDAGGAVLLISEDQDELLALCDRVAVMAGGALSPAVPRASVTVEWLGRWMEGRPADDPA